MSDERIHDVIERLFSGSSRCRSAAPARAPRSGCHRRPRRPPRRWSRSRHRRWCRLRWCRRSRRHRCRRVRWCRRRCHRLRRSTHAAATARSFGAPSCRVHVCVLLEDGYEREVVCRGNRPRNQRSTTAEQLRTPSRWFEVTRPYQRVLPRGRSPVSLSEKSKHRARHTAAIGALRPNWTIFRELVGVETRRRRPVHRRCRAGPSARLRWPP